MGTSRRWTGVEAMESLSRVRGVGIVGGLGACLCLRVGLVRGDGTEFVTSLKMEWGTGAGKGEGQGEGI